MSLFRNPEKKKMKSAALVAISYARAQFGTWLRDKSLFRAIRQDTYVAGYFLGRNIGLASFACGREGLDIDKGLECAFEYVFPAILGTDRAYIEALRPTLHQSNPRFTEGVKAGDWITGCILGLNDPRQHAKYSAAEAMNKSYAQFAPPVTDEVQKKVDMATALEAVTFGDYMLKNFGEEYAAIFAAKMKAEEAAKLRAR